MLCLNLLNTADSFATMYPQSGRLIGPAIRTVYYKSSWTATEEPINIQISFENDNSDTKTYYVKNKTEYLFGVDGDDASSSNVSLTQLPRSAFMTSGYAWRNYKFTISGNITSSSLSTYTITAAKNTCNLKLLRFKYQLVYNANGGSGTVPSTWKSGWTDSGCSEPTSSGSVPHNLNDDISYSTTHELSYPDGGLLTKTAYTHVGWSYSATGSKITGGVATISGSGHAHIDSDSNPVSTTVYAVFLPTGYTATFDNNGGSGATSATFNIEQSLALPTPTRAGYTFAGWKVTSASGNWSSGDTYTGSSVPAGKYGNVTFTAQWAANTYTVTFDYNGGSGSPASSTFRTGEAVSLPTATMVGSTFAGWKVTSASGNWTSSDVYTGSSVSAGKYGNVTLTAQWTIGKYTVSYDGNGATSGTTGDQSFTYGTAQNLRANGFSRTLTVSFDGQGGTPASSSLSSSSTFKGWEDRGRIIYGGTTYEYTQFDAPYYSNTYGDLYNAFGYNKYNLISHYVNNGKGEGRSPKGSTPGLYPPVALVNNLSTESGYTVPLYANWTDNPITLPEATREHYTFKGWYTSATGGTKIGDAGESYLPTSTAVTLYAQWELANSSITITRSGLSAGESAIYTVVGGGVSYTVVLTGEDASATLADLPTDTYTVTENSWSWTSQTPASQTADITGGHTFSFTASKKSDQPLNAEGSKKNW